MYRISVPLIANSAVEMGLEAHLKNLRRLNADRVFLSIGEYYMSEQARKREMDALRVCTDFFHQHGLEVGAWIWTFMIKDENDLTHMVGINGETAAVEICPSDAAFRKFAADYLSEIAACGVDLIQFDDDFRYGHLDGGMLGCACKNHLDYVGELLGEPVDRETLQKHALSGGKNKYRDAWQKSKGYYFELFAKEMRQAVDAVNPNIRLGLCSCMTTWDIDGTDAATLSRILAGGTKPFLRTIGAPYWAVDEGLGASKLQNVIEQTRMERSWCKEDIEVFSEGDCWPRPRYSCPAAYVEIFDTALRASGEMDGILKYDIEYNSNPGNEDGYILRHERHRGLYQEIDAHFSGKHAVGVRVYERMRKFSDMQIPEELSGSNKIGDFFFSPAAKMMSDNGIPTVYEGEGIFGIAFAENVSLVSEETMKKGLIIDLRAAQILEERGIDTGLLSVGAAYTATCELNQKDRHAISNIVHEIKTRPGAKILTQFAESDLSRFEKKHTIGSYYYKNKNGQQFLVFAFSAYAQQDRYWDKNFRHSLQSYMRSAELRQTAELFGAKLPAYSYGNPNLYLLAKKHEDSMAVGLWNIFQDEIFEPVIELDGEYQEIEWINCDGRMEGNRVYLSELHPYGIAGFEVRRKK